MSGYQASNHSLPQAKGMMPNQISKVDRDTIEALVEKYSAQAVANLAKSVKKAKVATAGRPKSFELNLALVWAHIEHLRRNSQTSRISNACRVLAKRIAKATRPPHLSDSSLRRMHWRAEKLRDSDAFMKTIMDDHLALLATQAAEGRKRGRVSQTYPVLWRKTKPETEETPTGKRKGPLTLDLTRP
jgi:hypothetical protein